MPRRRPRDSYDNSVEAPVYQSASYYFDDAAHVSSALHGRNVPAGRYGRYHNPTWTSVEEQLSELNSAERSLLFASGMAAHFTTFVALLKAGDHVAIPCECYRQVRNLFKVVLPKFGVVVHELSIKDPESFIRSVAQLSSQLKVLHLEMPSSPHMYLIDVARVKSVLSPDTVITMDSSFAPPPNFRALTWGVDLALFSATKYFAGHGDIVAGVVSGRGDLIEKIQWYRDTTGPVADGHAAFLLRRGLYTWPLRIAHSNAQGMQVAEFLNSHRLVKRVYYTGLDSHPHRSLARKYLTGHGGVVTFELHVGEQQTAEFVDRLELPYMASNFGGPKTLIEQSSFFTYFEYSDAELEAIGITRGTVRLALGYADDADAVVDDLARSLSALP
jgi:cystathionine gamma-synthase